MKSLLLIVAVLVAVQAYSPTYTGNGWQQQSADNKADTLYNVVMQNTQSNGWFSAVRMAELFMENLNTSFDFVGDDMPGQNLFNVEERPKVIHSVGAIAQAQYVDYGGHNFTGIFKGCSNAFLRLSLAAKPESNNIAPGLSMKFMRNNIKSGNIFAMYALTGQSSFNYFAHDLSNHPPAVNVNDPSIPFAKKMLFNAFSKASAWPTYLGVSDLAHYDQNGNTVANPVFPFRVIFHPVKSVHSLFPDAPQSGDSYFLKQFMSMAPGPVYEVYVQPTPFQNVTVGPIGRVDITTGMSSSMFGDRDMFFQHTRMEDDLAAAPSWIKAAAAIQNWQGTQIPAYVYPDLPFK
jgi:hypothetical protein